MSFSLISKFVNQSDLKLATESVRQSRPFEGVRCGSDINIEITPGYKGSTILNNSYFFTDMPIDSNVILNPGDRILLFGQTDDRENGIWSVSSIISGFVNIQRPVDYGVNTPIRSGQYVFITEGYKNGGILYRNTATEYDSKQNRIITYNGTSPQNWEPYYFTLIELISIDIPRFYSDSWFSGSYNSLPNGDYPSLSIVGIAPDTIGSVRVPPGFQVELYEFEYFQGRTLTLTSSNNNLAFSNFNNLTSSIRISSKPTFYSDPWYMGTYKSLVAGDYPNITNVGIFDNTISSVAVPTGFIVQLFENVNFAGNKITLISDSTSLTQPSFYSEFYYAGSKITLGPGNYPNLSLIGLGFANVISSVRVPPGFRVELYKNINYGGDKLTLTNDSSVLSSTYNNLINSIKVIAISNFSNLTAFDNLTSSIKVIEQPVFYSEVYYTGVNISFAAGSYPDISPYAGTISSVRVPPGYQVELYQLQYYQGASLILTSSNNNLALSGFDNLTSSIRIIEQPIFYSEFFYAGSYKSLPVGEYSDLSVVGIAFDNVISSVKVPSGIIVQLFKDINFGGDSLTLTSSTNSLDVSFDNLVSSIKILDKPTFYLGPLFTGPSLSLSSGEYPDLSITPYDNLINSVRIPAGYQVQLYEFANFLGSSLTLTTDNNNLGSFGNLTSSIKVTIQPSFYSESLYEGTYKTLPAGIYPDLSIVGLAINDIISSVRVPVGFQIELYKNANFVEIEAGEKITLTTDNNNLIPSGFDNTISAIKINAVPVFYSESFYFGGFVSLLQGDYPDLTLFDNLISSVKVPPGYQVELYKDVNFGGDKLTLLADNNLLALSGFDNVTSSIKVTVQPSFFTGYLYTGNYKTLNAGEYPDLSVVGLAIDNVIRSVKVPNRFIIELYKNVNFTGDKLILSSSTDYNLDLSTVGFNDSVSSIKIIDLPTFYGEPLFIGPNISLAYGDYLIIKPYAGIISSLRVPIGFQVELYQYDEFNGNKLVLTGDNNNLALSAFDNLANSIKITLQPAFFTGSLYTGNYKILNVGEYPDLSVAGLTFDNVINSVKVPLEFVIELYKDVNFGGASLILTNQTPYNSNLNSVSFGNSVSSIRVNILPTFYSGRLYTEAYLPLPYGDFPDLTLFGVTDNIITSVRVPAGFQVELYKNSNFGGDKLTLLTDNNDLSLGLNNFNDSVSSIKVTVQPSFFSGSLYSGTYKTLTAGEYYDLSTLGLDNVIKSVKVPLEFVIELYKDVNFGGDKLVLTNQTPYNNNLNLVGFADSVSSIRIIALPTFYTGSFFTDVYLPLSFGDYPNLSLFSADNIISSVKVPPGFQVELYKDANFGGDKLTLTSDINTLIPLGFDNLVSSIKVTVQPVFFTNSLYSGTYKTLTAGNYPDLSIVGLAINDVISSVKVPDGFIVELYKNTNFVETQVGEKLTLTTNNNNLASSGFDNVTSSIKITALPTFYSGPYYTETYISLTVGEYPILSTFDNLLSSVKVPTGFKVELYKDVNFGGDKLTLLADNNLLALSAFDNVTSSIKVSIV